ncbi:MAG: GxxExxY protein [Segetibacter sp.]|jgi:GxxExxY protein|nr:GxxExxY protein [Segetibacter sp.]
MSREDLKYSELTEIIINAAMKVHRSLGPGFPEIIYQRALEVELKRRDINYKAEQELPVFYEGVLVGKRRLDLLVESIILVELKAVSEFEKKNFNQVLNYLEAFNVEVGLLLNFGVESLQMKRFINNKFKENK